MAEREDSPPVPAAPVQTALTSHRYAALQKIYASALRATLSTNSYANFAACFPTPAKYCPRALEGVWQQLNTRLREECTKDFEKICQERDVEAGLASWEQLIEDAKLRKDSVGEGDDNVVKPMHLLTADELYLAHLTPMLLKTEQDLQAKKKEIQRRNREMAASIESQRREMQQLVEQLERTVKDIEGAAQAVQGLDI